MIAFAAFLRDRGFRVFQSGVYDALRAVQTIGLEDRSYFFFCLRSILTTTDLEWAQFQSLFDEFWVTVDEELEGGEDAPKKSDPNGQNNGEGEGRQLAAECEPVKGDMLSRDKEWLEGIAYSPIVSMVEKKDLSRFNQADVQVASLALKRMVAPFQVDRSRRLKRTKKSGGMDFQRIIKKSLKTAAFRWRFSSNEKSCGSSAW